MSSVELFARDNRVRHELIREPRVPALVVRHAQVIGRGQQLEEMTRVVQILASAAGAHDASHRVHTAFPRLVEHRLVPFVADRPHAVHAAHVVDAVHGAAPDFAAVTFATPTIESRVTSPASSCSLMC